MEFLNRVGENSKPNGFPLAFGKSIELVDRSIVGLPPMDPDWDRDKICQEYLDKYDYHLHQFGAHGYKTMIAQDHLAGIVFYPNCSGFKNLEADHVWRPFALLIQQKEIFQRIFKRSCSQRHIEMLDYLENFIRSYKGVPKIAQIWPTTLAHSKSGTIFGVDKHFLKFFQENEKNLRNAFVFLMGDHGPRASGVGITALSRYETNNPLLLITIPEKYRNSSIHKQLRSKSMELITAFDIQPEKNFSDSAFLDMSPLSKGSSLLRKWKGIRNCRTLPISSHYCLCQFNTSVFKDQKIEEELGIFLTENVNVAIQEHIKTGLCMKNFYNSTISTLALKVDNETIYETVVSVRPSGGIFSAHIRSTADGFKLNSPVIRRGSEEGDDAETLARIKINNNLVSQLIDIDKIPFGGGALQYWRRSSPILEAEQPRSWSLMSPRLEHTERTLATGHTRPRQRRMGRQHQGQRCKPMPLDDAPAGGEAQISYQRTTAPIHSSASMTSTTERLVRTLQETNDDGSVHGRDVKTLRDATALTVTEVWNDARSATSTLTRKADEGTYTSQFRRRATQFSLWFRRLENVMRLRAAAATPQVAELSVTFANGQKMGSSEGRNGRAAVSRAARVIELAEPPQANKEEHRYVRGSLHRTNRPLFFQRAASAPLF
ncbi:hypothetical protein RB195_013509 [Necator americanus]|uniref:Sulfatase N-terminal domain-containing protein n=1 Tax=Necator americanus TaxID=51031 RepID=A0ABR1DW11_NECAM